MAKRAYGQFCGLTHALDLVGERWALVIVRDLLVGPRRFTDLHRGLPGIPTNVLAARLKELEQAGLVHRRLLPRPATAVVYELTPYGAALEPAVLALARWGARSLTEPAPGEVVTVDSMIMALRSVFRPAAATGPTVEYELRMGDVVLTARAGGGRLEVAPGEAAAPDLVIESGPAIRALMAGELTPEAALQSGALRIDGDPALLARFAETFPIAAMPEAAEAA